MSAQAVPRKADRSALLLAVAAAAAAADQLAKALALALIPQGASIKLIPHALYLTLVRNPGGAFGTSLPAPFGPILLLAASAAAVVVIGLARRRLAATRAGAVCMGLIMGGALGNLIDRLFRGGKVVDFIDLRVWPVFNIADACITVAVIALIWLRLGEDIRARRARKAERT